MRKFMVTIEGKQYEVGVEEIGGAIAAGGWIALSIIAVIIIILVITVAVGGHLETMPFCG